MHFQNLHQHIEFFANTDQIPDEAITGTDEEELEVVSKEFVKVERLTDEDIDGDGKIADETPNQRINQKPVLNVVRSVPVLVNIIS